jgi:leucyl aminopeptidase (aminopeptidase T)
MTIEVLRNIFRVNLGIRKSEKVLIFTDRPSPSESLTDSDSERRSRLKCIAFLTAEIGKSFAREVIVQEYQATGIHGAEPPVQLWQRAFGERAIAALNGKKILNHILRKKADDSEIKIAEGIIEKFKKSAVHAVIALSNYSTSHTRFRDLLTRVCSTRYASMPLFDIAMLEGPMNIDWRHLEKMTRNIVRKVNKAETIEIRTENGSRLSFSTKRRRALADTGILKKPGSFGNLPAGEVYLAPVEGTAQGKLILEWAPTRELESPVTLIVKDGNVTGIRGEETYAAELGEQLSVRKENGNIAELGIGTNSMARRPDNILESEKILGTVHIALGDNSSFGGEIKTPFHQDYVFFKPSVTLIHKDRSRHILMKRGKFV